MRTNIKLGLIVLLASICAGAQKDAPRSYNVGGKTINYRLTIFSPPIPIQPDAERLNQDSAVNCTILFMSRLSHGDIAGAAAITTDPEGTAKAYSDARARMGDARFSQQMAALFNGDRYRFELVEGNEHVLITDKVDDGGQALIEKDGKFWMDRAKLQQHSKEFEDLFAVLNAHAAGKIEFK